MLSGERLIIENLFMIADKEGNDVDFIFNNEQIRLYEGLSGRDIIPKSRQLGFSTLFLGLFLARCLMMRNRKCVIISHSVEATQKLLTRVKYMIKHIKGPPPSIKYSNQNLINFDKMDSWIYIGTAGSGDFGVGDTITDLHCSEVSLWKDPSSLLTGLFQAVPKSGNIYIESTGRGAGNWFHRACMKAKSGYGYKMHFFDWLTRAEYSVDLTEEEQQKVLENLDGQLEEEKYLKKFNLSAGQIVWRRNKITELDYDIRKFKQEYPCELNECFQATGQGLFSIINYYNEPKFLQVSPWLSRHADHPMPNRTYVAGADVSAGVGQDASVLQIICVESCEQVLEYHNAVIEPDAFARWCVPVLLEFNTCYINPERNNHGILFVAELLRHYPKDRIHRTRKTSNLNGQRNEMRQISDYGTFTSLSVKALAIGRCRDLLKSELTIYSEALRMECTTYVEKPNGQIEAEQGCFDDRVMALAMATYVMPKVALEAENFRNRLAAGPIRGTMDDFKLENILAELNARYNGGDGCPIPNGLKDDSENSLYI